MKYYHPFAFSILLFFAVFQSNSSAAQTVADTAEPYRPLVHFTPKAHWMNDPNGMLYSNGTYHLFYQYYPGGTVWGPMHWGHATSSNLVAWQEQPIALYPDSVGYIFSGSAVADSNNTSGFGSNGKIPLVAIFTQHDMAGEKNNTDTFQTQSLAYSLDDGATWTKYAGNPVLRNPGIKDFRDPKVMWYAPQKKWVMTLATKDRVTFYSSKNLKQWVKESEFGAAAGAHGGVWECPDLFAMDDNGKPVWALLVSLNPGGPNGGSATQYFLGNFNGKTFTANSPVTKWLDYGPDDYAGVTWSNTGSRRIFLGWMSNWNYATKVPTTAYRSAMTLPRELRLQRVGKELYMASAPVKELGAAVTGKPFTVTNYTVADSAGKGKAFDKITFPCRITLSPNELKDFSLSFYNDGGEQLLVGYHAAQQQFFIDRTHSGITGFDSSFAARHTAPFIATGNKEIILIMDNSSIELFAGGGLTVMTALFFPMQPYNHVRLQAAPDFVFDKIEYGRLESK